MKSEELRIGNWLEDKDHFKGYFQVEGVAKYTVQSPQWTLELDEVAPIPLTEEWLIKFGFETQNDISGRFFSLCNHRVYLFTETFEFEFNTHDDHRFNLFKSFQYVHQLQNLYYSLTGEELTIKNT